MAEQGKNIREIDDMTKNEFAEQGSVDIDERWSFRDVISPELLERLNDLEINCLQSMEDAINDMLDYIKSAEAQHHREVKRLNAKITEQAAAIAERDAAIAKWAISCDDLSTERINGDTLTEYLQRLNNQIDEIEAILTVEREGRA